jgi:urea transport system permease protein
LYGAALGSALVNGAKSWFTVALPDLWLYLLAALFILTTLFLPEGLAGIFGRLRRIRGAT